MIGGFLSRIQQLKVRWNTKRILLAKKMHSYFGLLLVALAQVNIYFGVKTYYDDGTSGVPLGIINICSVFGIVIVCEVLYRVINASEIPYKEAKD